LGASVLISGSWYITRHFLASLRDNAAVQAEPQASRRTDHPQHSDTRRLAAVTDVIEAKRMAVSSAIISSRSHTVAPAKRGAARGRRDRPLHRAAREDQEAGPYAE
jgi:hypothetical protein